MFTSEVYLVEAVVARLNELALEHYLQVPCLSGCIDLVFVHEGLTTAVEFKLKDWRRGLKQAREHLLAADCSLVCLPQRRATSRMTEAFRDSGIGLALFVPDGPWPFEELIQPKMSGEKWPIAAGWLEETIAARRRSRDGVLLESAP